MANSKKKPITKTTKKKATTTATKKAKSAPKKKIKAAPVKKKTVAVKKKAPAKKKVIPLILDTPFKEVFYEVPSTRKTIKNFVEEALTIKEELPLPAETIPTGYTFSFTQEEAPLEYKDNKEHVADDINERFAHLLTDTTETFEEEKKEVISIQPISMFTNPFEAPLIVEEKEFEVSEEDWKEPEGNFVECGDMDIVPNYDIENTKKNNSVYVILLIISLLVASVFAGIKFNSSNESIEPTVIDSVGTEQTFDSSTSNSFFINDSITN